MAELQLLRGQLLELVTQVSGGDAELGVGVRAIQVALMEILDGVDEGEESADKPVEAAGSKDATDGGSGARR